MLVCENGEVRLLGLGVTGAGRVELCREREWGTVCSRVPQWSLKNAQVVCRSLGFTTAVTAIPQERLGLSLSLSLPLALSIFPSFSMPECNLLAIQKSILALLLPVGIHSPLRTVCGVLDH